MSDGERIAWSTSHGATVVHLTGEFDLGDVALLGDACQTAMAEFGDRVAVDLADATFLDSSALGVLVRVSKVAAAQGGWLRLAAASHPPVRRILEITTLDEVFGLFDTVQGAADWVAEGEPGDADPSPRPGLDEE